MHVRAFLCMHGRLYVKVCVSVSACVRVCNSLFLIILMLITKAVLWQCFYTVSYKEMRNVYFNNFHKHNQKYFQEIGGFMFCLTPSYKVKQK